MDGQAFIKIEPRPGPPPANRPPLVHQHQGGPPNPHPGGPPVPPNHQGQNGPSIPPQHHQPMMQAPHIPPPPPAAIPRELQQHHSVRPQEMGQLSSEISDLRLENMTEAQARELLSTYIVVRLVRTDNPHEVDDEGYPLKPTWEKVQISRENDVSQQDARRQVRHLEQTTKSVIEKKGECIPAIQRQLEHARDRLAQPDPDKRYCYRLVQFDSQFRRLSDREIQYLEKISKGDKHKKEKKYVTTSKKHKPKHMKERVAITAYFKRTPDQEQSGLQMLQEQERKKETRARVMPQVPLQQPLTQQPPIQQVPIQQGPFQQPPPPQMPPQQMPPPAAAQNPPQQPPRPPPPPQGQPGQQGNPLPPPGPPLKGVKVPGPAPKIMAITQEKGKDKNAKVKPNIKKIKDRRGSESSYSTSYDYSLSDGSDDETSPSSISSDSRSPKPRRGRSPTPAYRKPEHFGIPGVTGPRMHTRDEPGYPLQSHRPGPVLSIPHRARSPRPVVVARPNEDEYLYVPRRAPQPRIIQDFRHVSYPEVRREVLHDDIGRTDRRIHRSRINALHRERDIALDNDRIDRLGEDIIHRNHLERELRDEEHRWPEPRAQHFMRTRGPDRFDEPRRDNPFLSAGRRPANRIYVGH